MTVTKEIVNEEIAIYQPVCKACCRLPFYPLYLLVTSEVILPVQRYSSTTSVDGSEMKLGCVNSSDTLQTAPLYLLFIRSV